MQPYNAVRRGGKFTFTAMLRRSHRLPNFAPTVYTDQMKRPLFHRLHEFAADHIDGVQYPPMRPPQRRLFRFKYQMPWYQRAFIVVTSLATIAICLGVLAGLLFGVYVMFIA